MLRFTLWTVPCFLLAAPPARADDAEDKAAAFVEKLGGTVTRDANRPGKPVIAVSLKKNNVTDAGLKELTALKNLTALNLSYT
jgi:internalin A